MKRAGGGISNRDAANYFAAASIALAVLACAALVVAATMPLQASADESDASLPRRVLPMPAPPADVRPLMARVAGRRFIVPSQGLPAVKDSGAAQKLVERLKLQGVAQVGDELVAYVAVKGGGNEGKGTRLQTVHKGEQLLAFTVESVEPGRVTLSLEGVVVELRGG